MSELLRQRHSEQAARCFDRSASDSWAQQMFLNSPSLLQRIRLLSGEVFLNNSSVAAASSNKAAATSLSSSTALIVSNPQYSEDSRRRSRDDAGSSLLDGGVVGVNSIASIAGHALQQQRKHQHDDGGNSAAAGTEDVGVNVAELRQRALLAQREQEQIHDKIASAGGGSGSEGSDHHKAVAATQKWKPFRISATEHASGKVTCLAVDVTSNTWFASGCSDGAIRAWDLASGSLKLTMGSRHVGGVRGLAISALSPYMFSCGEDKLVKCWDLERHEAIRDYFGHLSAVYCVATHPRQDSIIVSGGRDQSVRVWDVRTRKEIFVLAGGGPGSATGHSGAVMSLATQEASPQLVSGGSDGLVYLWDLGSGRPITRLSRHKKAIRSLMLHPNESTLCTVAADSTRKWRVPVGEHMGALVGSAKLGIPDDMGAARGSGAAPSGTVGMDTVWSSAAYSPAYDCFAMGAEDGSLLFSDWSTFRVGHETKTRNVPGTAQGDGGILSMAYDKSGTVLLTGEGDKSIKYWKVAPATEKK